MVQKQKNRKNWILKRHLTIFQNGLATFWSYWIIFELWTMWISFFFCLFRGNMECGANVKKRERAWRVQFGNCQQRARRGWRRKEGKTFFPFSNKKKTKGKLADCLFGCVIGTILLPFSPHFNVLPSENAGSHSNSLNLL